MNAVVRNHSLHSTPRPSRNYITRNNGIVDSCSGPYPMIYNLKKQSSQLQDKNSFHRHLPPHQCFWDRFKFFFFFYISMTTSQDTTKIKIHDTRSQPKNEQKVTQKHCIENRWAY